MISLFPLTAKVAVKAAVVAALTCSLASDMLSARGEGRKKSKGLGHA